MSYCTASDVKTFNQDDDMDEDLLGLIIPAVSEAIDGYCRQSFTTSTGAELYDHASGEIRLRDPLLSLASVTTNAGQSFTAADCILTPESGPPYYRLRLKSGKWFQWSGSQEQSITITGTWGAALVVPQGIKLAALIWVSDLYATADVRGLTTVGGGGVKAAIKQLGSGPPDDVIPFLNPHRTVRIEALA